MLLARVAAVGAFVDRCRRVPNPLVDLGLFRIDNVRWANTAMFVFSIGFSAMFLGNVLFLTKVWGYSIMRAGLAVSVGPLIVAVHCALFGKLAGRVGQRRLLVPGGLVWASGAVYCCSRAPPRRTTSACTSRRSCSPGSVWRSCCRSCRRRRSGPAARQFGAGSAVNQSLRNLGATFGVALTVAFTAIGRPRSALDAFHHVWWLLAACGVTVSLLAARAWCVRRSCPARSSRRGRRSSSTDAFGRRALARPARRMDGHTLVRHWMQAGSTGIGPQDSAGRDASLTARE